MTPSAADLDAADPLAGFAAEFAKPPGVTYLDGNSLGLLCKPAEESLRTAVDSWRAIFCLQGRPMFLSACTRCASH